MKNNKLLYLLTIIITLFSFKMNARAEEYYYFESAVFDDWVGYGPLEGSDKFTKFASSICGKDSSNCKTICKDYPNSTSITYQIDSPCLGSGNSNIIKIKIAENYDDTIDNLQNSECNDLCEDKKSCTCYEYVNKNYCNNYNQYSTTKEGEVGYEKYKLCSLIKQKENENSAGNTNSSTDNTKNSCDYVFTTYDSSKKISFEISLTDSKKDIIIAIGDSEFYLNNGTYYNGILEGYKNRLYFYSKNETFSDFTDSFINKVTNNKSCPALYFGYDEKIDGNYIWYTAFSKEEFANSKYHYGHTQSSSNGMTEQEIDKTIPNFNESIFKLFDSNNPIEFENCVELFNDSPELLELLQFVVNLVKISIPLILIGLGILDFARAIFSGNEDGMKKAQSKFIKRVIIAVCIFLIPSLLKLFLTIVNGIWGNISPDFCGIL